MNQEIRNIKDYSRSSCEKIQGAALIPDSEIKIPLTIINGAREGKKAVLLSGIHGGEYVGVQTAIDMAGSISPAEVKGQIIIVHPVNIPAFYQRCAFVNPLDQKNMNRVFPGKPDGTISERIAFWITNTLFSQANLYLDLHGGDLFESLLPFAVVAANSTKSTLGQSLEAARLMDFPYVMKLDYSGTTFGTAGAMDIPGLLAEFGGQGVWTQAEVEKYTEGVKRVLGHFGLFQNEFIPNLQEGQMLQSFQSISAEQAGCWYPDIGLGDFVREGEKVGEIRDVFSHILQEYYAVRDGTVIVLTNSLAVNINDPLLGIGQHSIGEEYV